MLFPEWRELSPLGYLRATSSHWWGIDRTVLGGENHVHVVPSKS
jgi:hypothetical protein